MLIEMRVLNADELGVLTGNLSYGTCRFPLTGRLWRFAARIDLNGEGVANRAFNEARLILQAREKKGQTKEGSATCA